MPNESRTANAVRVGKPMYRGNVDRVKTDAAKIVRRLRRTDVTLTYLKREYHCRFETLQKAIKVHLSKAEYNQLMLDRRTRKGKPSDYKYIGSLNFQLANTRPNNNPVRIEQLRDYYSKAEKIIADATKKQNYPIPIGHSRCGTAASYVKSNDADNMLKKTGIIPLI